jgi:hypothetical protein
MLCFYSGPPWTVIVTVVNFVIIQILPVLSVIGFGQQMGVYLRVTEPGKKVTISVEHKETKSTLDHIGLLIIKLLKIGSWNPRSNVSIINTGIILQQYNTYSKE